MPIPIADYDPAWPRCFEAEAQRLHGALDGIALRIEHVGSTAVPGLAAKPVIDIQISVAALHPVEAYRAPLESLGYTYAIRPFPYFHRPYFWPHSHHVHVREAGSEEEARILRFRDWLRRHRGDRRAYEALKRSLASVADADTMEGRYRYSNAKTRFIRDIERRARDAAPHGAQDG